MEIDEKHKDTTPSESLVPLNNEEADKRLKNMIDKNGGVRVWSLAYHNWNKLTHQLVPFSQLPTFMNGAKGWLKDIDDMIIPNIYDESMSRLIRIKFLIGVFNNDLIRDAIISIHHNQIPSQFLDWKPFGGSEYYCQMKDDFYGNKMSNIYLMNKLDWVVTKSRQEIIKGSELPLVVDANPSDIMISHIDWDTLHITHKEKLYIVALPTTVGLQGNTGFWNMKQNKINANMEVFMDIWNSPDHRLSRDNGGLLSWKGGTDKTSRDKQSHQISKIKIALSKIIELGYDSETGEQYDWFDLKGLDYNPTFIVGKSFVDNARRMIDTHKLNEFWQEEEDQLTERDMSNEYDKYGDDGLYTDTSS